MHRYMAKLCATKEQFDTELYQNLVKIKKSLPIFHKGHLVIKQ